MDVNDFSASVRFPWAYRLAYVVNRYREPLLKYVEEEFGLIRPEWTVLLCVSAREGIIAKDIWEMTGQPRNSISRGAKSLEKKGLIRRSKSETDRRRIILELTPLGKEMFDKISPFFEDRETHLLSCLTGPEVEQLQYLLIKMVGFMDENMPEMKETKI